MRWIDQPSLQLFEERLDRAAAASGHAVRYGHVCLATDGTNGPGDIDSEGAEIAVQGPPGGPRVESVEPLQNSPAVREHVVGLSDMANLRRAYHQGQRRVRQVAEQIELLPDVRRGAGTARKSNDQIALIGNVLPPHRVVCT